MNREVERPLIVQHRLLTVFHAVLQDKPGALITVIIMFLNCTTGLIGSVKPDRIFAIVQSIRDERRALRIEERFENNQLTCLTISVQVTPNLHPRYSFGL